MIEAEFKPTLDLLHPHGGIGRSSDGFNDSSRFGRDRTLIGLKLRWSLFSGFRSSQRMYMATSNREQKGLQIEKLKRDLIYQ